MRETVELIPARRRGGTYRQSGASRATTSATAKNSCSTLSRVAALSHLPLSWQLVGCGLGLDSACLSSVTWVSWIWQPMA